MALSLPRMLATAEPAPAPPSTHPLFRFGVIADVQWADLEDGYNYARTTKRCYRGALGTLREAVDWWQQQQPNFIAQLGDLIDGQNAKLGQSVSAMEAATSLLNQMSCRVVNIVGNHELYNFDRSALQQKLASGASRHGDSFFSFVPVQGWRVVALDSYQESIQGWPSDDPRTRRAAKLLSANNPNIDPDEPGKNGNWFAGLPKGHVRRFVPYNGGLGREQIRWLRRELRQARENGERVIILSHTILAPQACEGTTMAFDYEEVLEAIRDSGKTVAMVLCGHDHAGGYHRDAETGVHHLTLCSPLNKGTDGKAYGIVEVRDDAIEIHGPSLRDLVSPSRGTGISLVSRRDISSLPAVSRSEPDRVGGEAEVMRFGLDAA